jgi:hypothetical protein
MRLTAGAAATRWLLPAGRWPLTADRRLFAAGFTLGSASKVKAAFSAAAATEA